MDTTQPAQQPPAASSPFQTLRLSTDGDGIATLLLDAPGKPVNTLSRLMLTELEQATGQLERETPKGLIIASGKARNFIAGADLFEIRKMSPAEMEQYLAMGQSIFSRIEALNFPTVAAIGGDCLGGGLELALACGARVAADDPSINIGLPEVKLGILPGWGGTVRLPRLIGLAAALPLMLAGKTLPPARARRLGIVDDVVRPEALLSAARRLLTQPINRRKPPLLARLATAITPARSKFFAAALKQTRQQTAGNYPAPERLLDVARTGWERGSAAGFEAERKALVELAGTDVARNLVRLFFLRQGAKKAIAEQIHAKGVEVKHAAVIGGGTMGAGIAYVLARAGINVRLIEVDPKAMSAGMGRVWKNFEDDVKAGRTTALDARRAMNRVMPTTKWTGLRLADVAIEAVVEKMPLKREIFAKLDRLCREDCVLASNTSSLSVAEMAAATAHPGRVVGLHFFNPVPKMPLVEVVRTPLSEDAALATAAGLAAKLGKTAVVVRDAPGFLVNRILIPYLAEALSLAGEGVAIATIDAALKSWGMPMGPFELLDEIGLDVSAHVLKSLGEQIGVDRVPVSAGVFKAIEQGWLGKKSGRGFYIYGKKRQEKPAINPQMTELISAKVADAQSQSISADDIAWRLVLPMVNETARLLDEGVVSDTDAVDLAMVLGAGFAPFRGGLVQFADAVGVAPVRDRLAALSRQVDARFMPAPLLNRLAEARLPLRDFAKLPKADASQPVHQPA